MDISNLTNAIKEIEKNVKVLENSKFEREKKLIINGENIKLGLTKSELKKLFRFTDDKKSVREIIKCPNFSKTIKCIEIDGGFIILK